jgi:hypothetical protein
VQVDQRSPAAGVPHAVHQLAECGASFGDEVVPDMPQVVKVHVREASDGDGGDPDAVTKGAVAQQLSLRAGEEQSVRTGQRVRFQVFFDGGQDRRWDDDDAAAGCSA